MPTPLSSLRTCEGGHLVSDANVVGMATRGDKILVWCVDHATDFDQELQDLGASRLQM